MTNAGVRDSCGAASEVVPQPRAPVEAFDYVVAHYEDMLLLYGREKGLRHARKHLGWYVDRFAPGVGDGLRTSIMTVTDPQAVIAALRRAFDADCADARRQAA